MDVGAQLKKIEHGRNADTSSLLSGFENSRNGVASVAEMRLLFVRSFTEAYEWACWRARSPE